jgi:hypothetical protein
MIVQERLSLVGPLNSGAAVGNDGAATVASTSASIVIGHIVAVYVRYNGDPPAATTDVTVSTAGGSTPAYNVVVLTNTATSGLYILRKGAAAIADSGDMVPVHDKIVITIAGANAGDSADVWLMVI